MEQRTKRIAQRAEGNEFLMRELSYAEQRVLSVIPTGEENAIKQDELAGITGYNTREIRLIMNSLRKEDFPICSGNNGYYKAKNEQDIKNTTRRMRAQVKTLNESLKHLYRSVKNIE